MEPEKLRSVKRGYTVNINRQEITPEIALKHTFEQLPFHFHNEYDILEKAGSFKLAHSFLMKSAHKHKRY